MGGVSTKQKVLFFVKCAVCAVILAIAIVADCVCVYWNEPLSQALGVIGAGGNGSGKIYYEADYKSQTEALEASDKLIREILGEGAVLLKNDGVLPLETSESSEKKISLLGVSSYRFVMGGSGSGAANTSNSVSFKTALEDVGYAVNPTLWDFYESGAGKDYGAGGTQGVGGLNQRLAEVPKNVYTAEVKNSFAAYGDAAVVVIGRSGSEGVDLARNLYSLNEKRKTDIAPYEDGQHYLELTKEEKDLLKMANESFDSVIVIINSPNAMELGFVDEAEYGVDACLWVGAVGQSGTRGIADIISGKVNPSGRLTDTYVYDNFSSPASANVGDYRYDGENYFYVTYSEGIYVGYKYYETRYEDAVLGRGNVGDYDYASTVKYPFGYGKSYTDFTWSDFEMNEDGDVLSISVDVANAADGVDGSDVVELYVGAPYTAGGLEKAAVALCGFEKISVGKGEKKSAEMTVDKKALVSYDSGKGAYVLEAGTYYLTAARNAHEAANNILAAKASDGAQVNSSLMTSAGDASFVSSFTVNETRVFDDGEKAKTENRFDDADLTNKACPAYDENFEYLTRSDWTGSFPESYSTGKNSTSSTNLSGYVETRPASEKLMSALDARGYEASGNPKKDGDFEPFETGKKGKHELVELIGKSYDDELWNQLLCQITVDEMVKLVESSGYKTDIAASINKPKTYDYDGPAGLSSFFTKVNASGWPVEAVMAATWNVALMERAGKALGNEALLATESGRTNGVNGWYAPGMNIHRTPFAGRNFEYYSEDSFLSGALGSAQVKGVQSKGIYCYLKHFALNNQESNRSCSGNGTSGQGLATWSNEQAIREIYLKPFEMTVAANKHGTLAIMTSFNRIGARWAGGHYGLINGVLRGEWGFDGFVITDYWEGDYMGSMQMLGAGGDAMLISAANSATRVQDKQSNKTVSLLRDSAKHILYTVAASSAMNGIAYGVAVSAGFPNYAFILIAIDFVAVAGVAVIMVFAIRKLKRERDAGDVKQDD